MINLELKYSKLEDKISKSQELIDKIHPLLWEKKGKGRNMLGWVDLPIDYNEDEILKITKKVERLKELGVDTLLVIGIGGSYLGAKAGIDFLKGSINAFDKIFFAGINVADTYTKQLEEKLKGKNWAICVISKSGTTLEPAISFRYFKKLLIKTTGKELSKEFITVITDKKSGVLHEIAKVNRYDTFVIPGDIGGRFSVLTPVGLFPMAFLGIDILKILRGARKARKEFKHEKVKVNIAYQYALGRYFLFKEQKKAIEIFTTYDPDYAMFSEWWKQLFAESEGKDGKGIFPTSVNYSKDLHSLGQIIQEGNKIFFETTLFNTEDKELLIEEEKYDVDKLNYLNKKSFAKINGVILNAVLISHAEEAKIPNFLITFKKANEETLGYLFYFFFVSVTISGYLLEINPFDQPGVESYKKNMFDMLKTLK